MPRVLVVEDAAEIRTALTRALTGAGHAVRACGTGMEALRELTDWSPDVVVLDLGLPDIDGSALLRMIRGVSAVAVVVATARDNETEVVRLLRAGADDYLVKPFSVEQLDARIGAVLRRAGIQPAREDVVVVGGLAIDLQAREAVLDGVALQLSRREFDLLAYLAERAGKVVSRRDLLADVWRQAYGGGDETIDVHVSWLRRKLGETAARPRYLHTVRGVGIKLVAPAS